MDCIENKLIRYYKEAWENHDLHLLDIIFHPEIRYQEHCDNIITGIESLKEYWIDNKRKQKNVVFTPSKIISQENETSILWNCIFYHKIKKKTISINGIIWIVVENEKIIDFTEFFEMG